MNPQADVYVSEVAIVGLGGFQARIQASRRQA